MTVPGVAEKFETWAIVEVMGHQRYAGRVSEQQVGGASFVRVDVPELTVRDHVLPPFTKLLGSSAIFSITPCTEETARRAAAAFRVVPFETFSAPRLTGPAGASSDDSDCDEDDLNDDWGL